MKLSTPTLDLETLDFKTILPLLLILLFDCLEVDIGYPWFLSQGQMTLKLAYGLSRQSNVMTCRAASLRDASRTGEKGHPACMKDDKWLFNYPGEFSAKFQLIIRLSLHE